MDSLIPVLAVYAIPVIFAITLHEAAHGYVARRFGDSTAWMLGRVTLNPAKHIDPIGTLLVPALLLFTTKGATMFGWAKPVPVNFDNLRNPKQHMIWVAAAGPAANVFMALCWAGALKLQAAVGAREEFFIDMARAGVLVNLALMALNLLPIPPLDGGRIVTGLLPGRLAVRFASIERYGLILVFLMVAFPGVLSHWTSPLVAAGVRAISALFGF